MLLLSYILHSIVAITPVAKANFYDAYMKFFIEREIGSGVLYDGLILKRYIAWVTTIITEQEFPQKRGTGYSHHTHPPCKNRYIMSKRGTTPTPFLLWALSCSPPISQHISVSFSYVCVRNEIRYEYEASMYIIISYPMGWLVI